MELRYRLALVTGAGTTLGREVAVRLGRAGAGVLAADPDTAAAQETARLVRERRVWAASVQVDTHVEADVRLLAARVHDLGGVALVVDAAGGSYDAFLRDLLAQEGEPRWVDAATLSRLGGRGAIGLLRAG
ncbi:SDR family NAD(P)-dependent oxidoreductase [Marmoricola endophyticus]|uniref:SDR family NAD(P)-dependent oxidoreductase n=1 Tax=Marmoricola endophyticus TaxID=2040280 RepID=UPI001667A715|nr:SDR family NAD(P)-dependent oxidoreductase [Marmoricola endophyticus]